jgi:hypothetical protein
MKAFIVIAAITQILSFSGPGISVVIHKRTATVEMEGKAMEFKVYGMKKNMLYLQGDSVNYILKMEIIDGTRTATFIDEYTNEEKVFIITEIN